MGVKAIVTLTVEIHLDTYWNEDSTFKEVEERATRDATTKLNVINDHIEMIGNPHVKTIIVCEDK